LEPNRIRLTTDPSLRDHQRLGKRLIAPWNQRLGDKLVVSLWHSDRLPEVVWIAELIHGLGASDSLKSLCTIVSCAFEAQRRGDSTAPLLASYWGVARDETKNHVRKTLRVNADLDRVCSSLQTLSKLYPAYPMNFLCHTESPVPDDSVDVTGFKKRLRLLCDRFSHATVVVHAHMVKAYVTTGHLKVPADGPLPSLDPVYDANPNTESPEYRNAEGFARAAAGNYFLCHSAQLALKVAEYFWNRGLELEPCDPFRGEEKHE